MIIVVPAVNVADGDTDSTTGIPWAGPDRDVALPAIADGNSVTFRRPHHQVESPNWFTQAFALNRSYRDSNSSRQEGQQR